jgi:hypothetical protein
VNISCSCFSGWQKHKCIKHLHFSGSVPQSATVLHGKFTFLASTFDWKPGNIINVDTCQYVYGATSIPKKT